MVCIGCVVITYYIALLRCDREDSILSIVGSIRMGFGPPLESFVRTVFGLFKRGQACDVPTFSAWKYVLSVPM